MGFPVIKFFLEIRWLAVMHIWYLTIWWIAELMVCEGDLNEFDVRTNVGYGKLLLQYIWSTCVFV